MLKRTLKKTCVLSGTALSVGLVAAYAEKPISRTAAICPVAVEAGVNFVGVSVTADAAATGGVTGVAGTTITVDGVDAANYTSSPHSIRILSGAAAGQTREVTGNSGTDFTVASAFTGLESNGYAKAAVIPHLTLGTLFGTTDAEVSGAGLTTSASAAAADEVTIADGGVFTTYFFTPGGGFGGGPAEWKSTAAPAGPNQNDAEIAPGAGIMINAKSAGTVNISGIVNTTKAGVIIGTGLGFYSSPFNAALTLDDSGLSAILAGSASAASADPVTIEDGGIFTTYFYNPGGGFGGATPGWRSTSNPSGPPLGDTTSIPKGGSVLIDLGGAPVEWIVSE